MSTPSFFATATRLRARTLQLGKVGVLGLTLLASCGVGRGATVQTPVSGVLSPPARQKAVVRGNVFLRRALRTTRKAAPNTKHVTTESPSASATRGEYCLLDIAQAEAPRIHEDIDLSLLVLTGHVRVLKAGGSQELRPGETLEVASGNWYVTEPLSDGMSSVLFAFDPSRIRRPAERSAPLQATSGR